MSEAVEEPPKWRHETSWWDDLEIDMEAVRATVGSEKVFEWLAGVAPAPLEHDFILYTDGSGCSAGWGGYAALYEQVDFKDGVRCVVDSGAVVSGTYGSTVQRSEFNAFLDGVFKILTSRCEEIHHEALADEHLRYKLGSEGALNQFTGPERVTIMWYTDRENLAKCFLYDDEGRPLYPRTKERDLWLRWSFMAPYVCITPMCNRRNVIGGQSITDKLAGSARKAMMETQERFSTLTQKFHPTEKWQKKIPQGAQF